MSPLLLTITFLMVLGALTTATVKEYVDSSFASHFYEGHCSAHRLAQWEREQGLYHAFKTKAYKKKELEKEKFSKGATKDPSKKKKRSVQLNFNLNRPPDNSLFSLYQLFNKEDNKKQPEQLTLYEIGAALIRNLYRGAPFFEEIPQLEYRILDTLLAKKGEIEGVAHLAKVEFENEKMQRTFYQMLSGTPSLLDHFSFEKPVNKHHSHEKINLLFASEELVGAVFRNPQLTERILGFRTELWNRILLEEPQRQDLDSDKCLTATNIKETFEGFVESLLGQVNLSIDPYKKVCDFSLNRPGSYLWIEDPATGIIVRQKILKE